MSMKIRPWRHPCRYPSQAGQSGEEDDLTKIFALKKSTTFCKVSWFILSLIKHSEISCKYGEINDSNRFWLGMVKSAVSMVKCH